MANQETLRDRIQEAQVVFIRSASNLLDTAEEVKRQRDELLKLLEAAGREQAIEGTTNAH